MNHPWTEVGRKLVAKARVFDLYAKRMRLPDGVSEDDYFFLDTLDYVNVIPITPDSKIVLVKQHRHGISASSLEIPGGMLDAADEDPAKAALRELEEETGFQSSRIEKLGVIHPNPALQNNRCHLFVAYNAVPSGKVNLDHGEDVTVELRDKSDLPRLIASGEITHSMMLGAFYLLSLKEASE